MLPGLVCSIFDHCGQVRRLCSPTTKYSQKRQVVNLCQLCKSAPLFNLPKLKHSSQLSQADASGGLVLTIGLKGLLYDADYPSSPPGFKHHTGLSRLQESAKECALCALIEQCVSKFIPHLINYLEDDIASSTRPFGRPESFQLWLCARNQGAPGFIIHTDSNRTNQAFFVGEVAFLSSYGDLAIQNSFPGRLIKEESYKKDTLRRANEWLENCENNHMVCRSSGGALPTRVLDLQAKSFGNDIVVLRNTAGKGGKYATLSYCWGTAGNLKTTTKTIESHRRGIRVASLPKTISDAIIIARHLGLRYLWVDSLCIIQDDSKDWEREAQAMARVYSNAFINISALGARDTSKGCLVQRDIHQRVVPLNYNNGESNHQVFATDVTQKEMGSKRRDLAGYPTSERGWTLQERILARRTLHLGRDQMYFECGWGFQCEDGYSETNDSHALASTLKGVGDGSDNHPFFQNDMANSLFDGFEGWARLVNIYGTRQLTKTSDKLPAFSGIAQRYEALLDDVYVAGLWKGRLIEDLHWGAESWSIPSQYRAPTWSWLSIDGPIHMPDMKVKNLGKQCATALDYSLTIKGQNPYGELVDGWLKIEAPLAEVQDGRIFGYRVGIAGLNVRIEIPEEVFDQIRIFTLHLYNIGDDPWTALLITPVGDVPGVYRRVGKVTNMTDRKADEIPGKQTVILV